MLAIHFEGPENIYHIRLEGPAATVALVQQLLAQVELLNQQVAALQERLGRNSRNSNQPPSSDGFNKQPRSLRQRTGKRPGGQEGHPYLVPPPGRVDPRLSTSAAPRAPFSDPAMRPSADDERFVAHRKAAKGAKKAIEPRFNQRQLIDELEVPWFDMPEEEPFGEESVPDFGDNNDDAEPQHKHRQRGFRAPAAP